MVKERLAALYSLLYKTI